ncbi:MAG: UDP-3-O-(3-hydroxymyristoyl)glucosamine N-acyltransferase [Bacteroidota bacterium]|nr:UDP-3-O-(3-hydroxymyristoyl)glucosamine N-acyltransferase [Bacteroidota bacterium]
MQISAGQLCDLLNGSLEGDSAVIIFEVAKIEEGKEGALSFLSNSKYEEFVYNTKSSVVLVNKSFIPAKKVKATLIKVDDAYTAFTIILEKFSNPNTDLLGIETQSYVDPSAILGDAVYIGFATYVSKNVNIGQNSKIYPQVFLGRNVKVGSNCIIYPGVKIYEECIIGDNCIIHGGTVIGSDGFGFAPQPDRSYKKIPQTGNVIIEDDVEIGANCAIDRATMGSTIIRKGAKIDNLVQVAHNVDIGESCAIAGQAGVAGSAKLGKYCVLGGQVAVTGHIVVADGNQFGGQSGVNASIADQNKKWFGTPVNELRESLQSLAIQRRLPEMLKRIEELEKKMENKFPQ